MIGSFARYIVGALWWACICDGRRMKRRTMKRVARTRASCPTGLIQRTTDPPSCQWDTLEYAPTAADVLDDVFESSSDAPLSWNLETEVFQFDSQFMDELVTALKDEKMHNGMLIGSILDVEYGQGRSTKQALGDALWKVVRGYQEIAVPANLARMVLMPASIVTGLGKMAAAGIIAGGGWIPVVGWAVTAVLAVAQLATMGFAYAKKDRFARRGTEMLAMRARCVKNQISFTPEMASTKYSDGDFFIQDVAEVCSEHGQAQVLAVMQRANAALRDLLDAVEQYATCLFPGPWVLYGEGGLYDSATYLAQRTRKSACFAAVNELLVRLKDQPGLLTTTLTLITAYGQSTDGMLQRPLYGDWMKKKFGISIEAGNVIEAIKKQVAESDDIQDSRQAKLTTCMMLTATHRAYEMTFKRLTKAWKIYAQSYMRDETHVSARTMLTPKPCTAAFTEIELPLSSYAASFASEVLVDNGQFCQEAIFTTNGTTHVTGGTFRTDSYREFIHMDNIGEVCDFAKDHEDWNPEDTEDHREEDDD